MLTECSARRCALRNIHFIWCSNRKEWGKGTLFLGFLDWLLSICLSHTHYLDLGCLCLLLHPSEWYSNTSIRWYIYDIFKTCSFRFLKQNPPFLEKQTNKNPTTKKKNQKKPPVFTNIKSATGLYYILHDTQKECTSV